YTFPATANAVVLTGATPVLVDVDPHTMNLDPSAVYDAVTERTRAVIAVHLFGRPLDWKALQSAVPPDVALIEDAAGALGARWRGMPCGVLGGMGCLPFHPRKVVTTGEGGAVATSDAELDSGLPPLPPPGIPQLARLDELIAGRRRVAEAYTDRLRGAVVTPGANEGDEHGWQAYVVQLDRRDEVLTGLRAEGIEAQIGTYALHRLVAFHDQ